MPRGAPDTRLIATPGTGASRPLPTCRTKCGRTTGPTWRTLNGTASASFPKTVKHPAPFRRLPLCQIVWYITNVLVDRLSKQDAQDLVRRCRAEGRIIVGRHFRDELENERLVLTDVWEVLRKGQIYSEPEPDIRTREWKYRMEGWEQGGKWLAIVLTFKAVDTAFLVTIFSVESRSSQ